MWARCENTGFCALHLSNMAVLCVFSRFQLPDCFTFALFALAFLLDALPVGRDSLQDVRSDSTLHAATALPNFRRRLADFSARSTFSSARFSLLAFQTVSRASSNARTWATSPDLSDFFRSSHKRCPILINFSSPGSVSRVSLRRMTAIKHTLPCPRTVYRHTCASVRMRVMTLFCCQWIGAVTGTASAGDCGTSPTSTQHRYCTTKAVLLSSVYR